MSGKTEIVLLVNNASIELNPFTQDLILKTVAGMVSSLKGTGGIKSIDISLKEGMLTLKVNESPVIVNPFVEKIVSNTLVGMVSTLKGAATGVQSLAIKITLSL